MHLIDYSIVSIYLIGMVLIGLVMRRKASAGIDSYFLGNRSLPWWMLGTSGMASNLDVTGTMINTIQGVAFRLKFLCALLRPDYT